MDKYFNQSMFTFILYCAVLITLLELSKHKNVQNIKKLIIILVYFSLLSTGYTIGIVPALGTWFTFGIYSFILFTYLDHLKVNVYKLEGEKKSSFIFNIITASVLWPFTQEALPSIVKFKILRISGKLKPRSTKDAILAGDIQLGENEKDENLETINSIEDMLDITDDDFYEIPRTYNLDFKNADEVENMISALSFMRYQIGPNGITTYFDNINLLQGGSAKLVYESIQILETIKSSNSEILKESLTHVKYNEKQDIFNTDNFDDNQLWSQWEHDLITPLKQYLKNNIEKYA